MIKYFTRKELPEELLVELKYNYYNFYADDDVRDYLITRLFKPKSVIKITKVNEANKRELIPGLVIENYGSDGISVLVKDKIIKLNMLSGPFRDETRLRRVDYVFYSYDEM